MPSDDVCRVSMTGVPIVNASPSVFRSGWLRSVICAKSVTPRAWIQWNTCRPWKRGTPRRLEGLLDFGTLKFRQICFGHRILPRDVWKNDRPSCYHLRLEVLF